MRHVVLVCGPPCAGKTTYVRDRAQRGDVIVDFDELAQQAGSSSQWDHPDDARATARAKQHELERAIGKMHYGAAWVIRTAPTEAQRESLRRKVGATSVVVIDPGRDDAIKRARADKRPPWTEQVIDNWYAKRDADAQQNRPS